MLVVPVVHSIRAYRHVGGAGGALYQDLPQGPAMLVVPVVHSIRTYRHVGGAGGALY